MTTYNTGNTLGSVDVRDLYDNAQNLDNFVNGSDAAYADRFGVQRQSLQGVRSASQYQVLGPYAAGLVFTQPNQVFSYLGEFYSPGPSITLPYTTTGAGAGEIANFRSVGDAMLRSDLASAADTTKGATLVGRATRHIKSIAELRTVPGRYDGDMVNLLGYYTATPGFGRLALRWSSASVAADNSATIFAVVGVATGRWVRVEINQVFMSDFGAKADGVSDDTAALQSARDYMATVAEPKPALVFDGGIYKYTTSPNWNIDNLDVRAEGNVYLRPTAVGGIGIKIDSGALITDRVFNCNWGAAGNFIIQGVAGNSHAIYARGMIHGSVTAKVYGAGSAAAGLRMEGCVLVESSVTVTPGEANGTAWYSGAKPLVGISLADRGIANTQTAYCSFRNWSVQGCTDGIYLNATLGNIFFGGDSEYNTGTGVTLAATAVNNRFFGTNFEVNTNADIFNFGNYNEFHGCDTGFLVQTGSGAKNNQYYGGNHVALTDAAGALDTLYSGVKYNRGLGIAVINTLGTRTRFRDVCDLATGIITDRPKQVINQSVGASPWSYTNNTGNPVRIHIVGGTIGSIVLYQGAGSASLPIPGASSGVLTTVLPGEIVQIGYTVAPTVKVFYG